MASQKAALWNPRILTSLLNTRGGIQYRVDPHSKIAHDTVVPIKGENIKLIHNHSKLSGGDTDWKNETCCRYCGYGGYEHLLVEMRNGQFMFLQVWCECLTYSAHDAIALVSDSLEHLIAYLGPKERGNLRSRGMSCCFQPESQV